MPKVNQPYVLKVEKPWGFELILSNSDAKITSKILHVTSGKRSSLQYHDQKEEVLTLILGEGILELKNEAGEIEKFSMEPRKGYLIKINQIHRFGAGGVDCEIMEASTGESGNTVRIVDDFNRDIETPADRATRLKGGLYTG